MSLRRKPSHSEITNRVKDAITAIKAESVAIIDDRHDDEALQLCDAKNMDEVLDYVLMFLEEIEATGAYGCFASTTVPKCSHKGFTDIELFGYSWFSTSFQEQLYLKFGIRKPTKKNPQYTLTYYHLDLHHDRPPQD